MSNWTMANQRFGTAWLALWPADGRRARCALCALLAWGCVLAVTGVALADSPPLFSFVQISDVHLHDDGWIQQQRAQGVKEGGYRNPLTTPLHLRTALAWVDSSADASFVLLTGDIIETANPTRYAALTALMGKLQTPWVLVPGNHDYGIERLLPADLRHGGLDLAFSRHGVHFLGLAAYNPPGMSQVVSRETMAKVAAFCVAHRQEPVVLFCHTPLVTSKGETSGSVVPVNSPQVLAVLARCGNVVAVLSGHDHTLWSRVEAGILHACGPGFCDALGVPPYSFRTWQVHADRLEGVVHHVTAAGQVQQVEVAPVVFPWPAELRPSAAADPAPVRPVALPAGAGEQLAAWFGRDWVAVPGFELPPDWREDTVLVPGRQPKPARLMTTDEKHAPPADAQGREWFQPDYAEPDSWQPGSVPAVYWDSARPQPGHRRLHVRLHLPGAAWQPDTLRRLVLRSMVYRDPKIYLNGRRLPVGGATGNYWDGYTVVAAEQVTAGDNVLAISLLTSGWGGYKLDVELAAERK